MSASDGLFGLCHDVDSTKEEAVSHRQAVQTVADRIYTANTCEGVICVEVYIQKETEFMLCRILSDALTTACIVLTVY